MILNLICKPPAPRPGAGVRRRSPRWHRASQAAVQEISAARKPACSTASMNRATPWSRTRRPLPFQSRGRDLLQRPGSNPARPAQQTHTAHW